MEAIRVTGIQVVRLFDEINYDIRLEEEKPVGIIIAPNGRGKTTLLKLLAFALRPDYDRYLEIRDIPFSRFVCSLSNRKKIVLRQVFTEQTAGEFRAQDSRGARVKAKAPKKIRDLEYVILPAGKDEEKGNKGIRLGEILDRKQDFPLPADYFTEAEMLEMFENRGIPSAAAATRFSETLKKYIAGKKCVKPVIFIGTSRLQQTEVPRGRPGRPDGKGFTDPLEQAVEHIAEIIRTARGQYNMEVSKAKDRLPRLFLQNDEDLPEMDVFLEKWKAYTEELEKFQRIGLIEQNKEFIRDSEIPHVYGTKKEFLNTYLAAFRDTTRPLNEVYDKLNLFKSIFDERNSITHKTVTLGTDGLELYFRKKRLDFAALSSGEKHDFIMFYNLIFNAEKGSMVLVDEPEISLHIEWQESYLDHLIEICAIHQMQAVVATHSPHIISSHFDCLVDKGEYDDPD